MLAGDLNKRITWQSQSKVSDGAGGFTVTWDDVKTTFAAIWPVSANEIIRTEKPTMEISHRIRIRYRSNFRPDWRGKYGNKYYNIIAIVNPEMRNEFLDILCKETQ